MAKINTVTVDVENNIYPAYGFFFQVNFLDISSSDLNTRFQSVNGISKTSKSKKLLMVAITIMSINYLLMLVTKI